MSIEEKIQTIRNIKNNLMNAISNKGVMVAVNTPFTTYSNKVGEIDTTKPLRAFDISGSLLNYPQNVGVVSTNSEIQAIPQYMCYGFLNATGLVIANTVKTIGAYAFYQFASSAVNFELTVPDSVEQINNFAFAFMTKATKVTIGVSIKSIGASGFASLTNCNLIVLSATTPPTIQTTTFSNLKSTCVFKVPASSVDSYKAATNWSAFASRIQSI